MGRNLSAELAATRSSANRKKIPVRGGYSFFVTGQILRFENRSRVVETPQCGILRVPPPDFRVEGDAVRALLYAPRRFAEMTAQERIRACYQHAALKYVSGQKMTNSSLRERLGIEPQNAAQASTVIRQAQKADLIRPADPAAPRSGYIPYWA